MGGEVRRFVALAAVVLSASAMYATDVVPKAAFRLKIGVPPANPGRNKPIGNIDDGYWQGAPVGGFGAGTFSRSYRGDFVRWHMKAGVHKYESVPGNQFAVFEQSEGEQPVAMALSTAKPEGGALSAWNWYPTGEGEYAAAYPKSWYVYDAQRLPVKLTVEQFSPVMPNNYKESSYPVAVYQWYATNPTQKPVTVSLLFSWTNMVGWFRDETRGFGGALNAQNTDTYKADGAMKGIIFDRIRGASAGTSAKVQDEWDGQFAIATNAGTDAEVSYLSYFNPTGDGSDVWQPFARDGRLQNKQWQLASSGDPFAGAIAVRFTLAPGQKRVIPMALAWDLPITEFGGGRKWVRHYTKFFGESGTNAWQIAKTALEKADTWSKQIDAWQQPILNDDSKPEWYRGELFNELYILTDGGTMWGHELGAAANPLHESAVGADSFSYLECFDYLYYGTLDVRFYGSFPLAQMWPDIEKQEMREYTDTIAEANPQRYIWGWMRDHEHKLEPIVRKVAGAAPHDLGSPTEDPFVRINQYNYQDVSNWRDLNSKYVLMVWRDYKLSGANDRAFLQYTWPAVKQAMEHLREYDTNGDGLIENGGFPDQTYDNWIATGESAYSGGLYLASLRATAEIARSLGDPATAQQYDAQFTKAQKSYVAKLWNGSYFNYDTGGANKTDIMAEQLAGQWYADLTGLGDLVPKPMRRSALERVFQYNVQKFGNGEMGAVNGIGANGEALTQNEQVEEVWTGTTFGVASHMISEGMREQGFATAKGVYNVVYGRGYWFRTPEAYDVKGEYRASMYMRPGAIWAMELSLAQTQH